MTVSAGSIAAMQARYDALMEERNKLARQLSAVPRGSRDMAERTTKLEEQVASIRQARDLILSIAPEADDYFILKPRHSAFYETALESLLEDLKVERLVLCGIAGDGCIHATATDAHMRKYEVAVVRDATASQTAARNRTALSHLENAKYASLCAASRTRL